MGKRWILTRRKRFSTRSRMGSLGWILIQRQMLKKSKRSTKRLRVFVRRSFPSTTVLGAAAAAVEPKRMRRKHTMSCRELASHSRADTLGCVDVYRLLMPSSTVLRSYVQFLRSSYFWLKPVRRMACLLGIHKLCASDRLLLVQH